MSIRQQNISSDFIRGHIDTIILRVLLDGDNYGYEIIKTITLLSEGQYELKEPSLYTSLKRLEGQKWIEAYWGNETQGGRRKYYRMTDLGKHHYIENVEAWKKARTLLNLLIEKEV